jgi:hypothetical protein
MISLPIHNPLIVNRLFRFLGTNQPDSVRSLVT